MKMHMIFTKMSVVFDLPILKKLLIIDIKIEHDNNIIQKLSLHKKSFNDCLDHLILSRNISLGPLVVKFLKIHFTIDFCKKHIAFILNHFISLAVIQNKGF